MTAARCHCLLYFVLLFSSGSRVLAQKGQDRKVRVINEAGFKVNIYWINRWKNDELVLNSEEGVFHGAETQINSYVSHEFEVQEVPHSKLGHCRGPNNTCRKGYFRVNANDDQLVRFMDFLEVVEHTDNVTKARQQAKDVLQECKASALEHLDEGRPEETMNKLLDCIETSVETATKDKRDEIGFQENLRQELGSKLAKYACKDKTYNQTMPIQNTTWTSGGVTRPVRVMMDRPTAKIHLVENFATDSECQTMMNAVDMQRFDGVEGFYGSMGGTAVPWDVKSNPITTLASKMFVYTRDLLQVPLSSNDEEQIFVMRYEGRGKDAPSLDRYETHCDGYCDGSTYKRKTRIATFVVYCQEPEEGGATQFENAGIYLIPKKGAATFYTYVDHKSDRTDTGFTQTSECGVAEGTKTTITYNIRY